MGKRARHRYHHDKFVIDADEYVVDGDDDGRPVLAGFAGAGGAKGDEPEVASFRFRQGRR